MQAKEWSTLSLTIYRFISNCECKTSQVLSNNGITLPGLCIIEQGRHRKPFQQPIYIKNNILWNASNLMRNCLPFSSRDVASYQFIYKNMCSKCKQILSKSLNKNLIITPPRLSKGEKRRNPTRQKHIITSAKNLKKTMN